MAETSATSLDEGDPDQILNDWALTPADLEQIRRARSRGRPNSRVTRGHLGQSRDSLAFMSSSERP